MEPNSGQQSSAAFHPVIMQHQKESREDQVVAPVAEIEAKPSDPEIEVNATERSTGNLDLTHASKPDSAPQVFTQCEQNKEERQPIDTSNGSRAYEEFKHLEEAKETGNKVSQVSDSNAAHSNQIDSQPNIDSELRPPQSSSQPQNSLEHSSRGEIVNSGAKQHTLHSEPQYDIHASSHSHPADYSSSAVDQLKLFVGGLYYQNEDDIFDYFSQFGEVVNSQLMRHRQTGRSRGFAFVTLKDPDGSVRKQILSRRNEINGNYVDVKPAEDGKTREKVERNSAKCFVGGIEGTVSTEELRDFFQNYGPVKEALVLKNINTNVSRGFGFVTFENKDDADIIVRENNCVLKGKRMDIKWAEPKDSINPRSNHRMMEAPVATIAPYAPPPVHHYKDAYMPMHEGGMMHMNNPAPQHRMYQQNMRAPAYEPEPYYQQPMMKPVHQYRNDNMYQMSQQQQQQPGNYYMNEKAGRFTNSYEQYKPRGQNIGGGQSMQGGGQDYSHSHGKPRYKPY